MKSTNSAGYNTFLIKQKNEKRMIHLAQIGFLLLFLMSWELLANIGFIDTFFFSKPSEVWALLWSYTQSGDIFIHLMTSVCETILGLVIGTLLGLLIAIALWLCPFIAKMCDPFLVTLNALPKTALAPILIVWIGAGIEGIVVVAIMTSIVITIMSAYNYFLQVDPDQLRLLKSFEASKFQILSKLILPSNYGNLINIIKINIGMSWVGVIVGEFIVSRAGIGYLIVYGGQVFQLDLDMMGIFVLSICSYLMYAVVNAFENHDKTHKKKTH